MRNQSTGLKIFFEHRQMIQNKKEKEDHDKLSKLMETMFGGKGTLKSATN